MAFKKTIDATAVVWFGLVGEGISRFLPATTTCVSVVAITPCYVCQDSSAFVWACVCVRACVFGEVAISFADC